MYITVVLLLLSSFGVVFAWDYPASSTWNFEKYSSVGFNQAKSFSASPYRGVPYDSSLIGYWNFNEGSGTVIQDLSSNGNNGTVNSSTWVTGKFGDALSFNGSLANYVKVNNSISLQVTGNLTLSCWVNFNTLATKQTLIFKSYSAEYELSMSGSLGKLEFDNTGLIAYSPISSVKSGVWLHVAVVRNAVSNTILFYVNGAQVGIPQSFAKLPISSSNPVYVGQENGYNPLNGAIDDVRIYNRALTAMEILALFQQEDPLTYANYYYFADQVTNSTLIINADSPSANSSNTALVTCTNLFTNNILTFQANNTASVNVWTNLGQPIFIINGVWNNQNYTTTLTLDVSSTGVLNWNPGTPPASSNLSISLTAAGKTTSFSSLWSDNQSLFGGGYIFSTNNTGQWVNASWTAFSSTPSWGNATLTLDSKAGVVVGFREYANNSLNIWANSGLYTITTTNDSYAPLPTPLTSSIPTTRPTTSPTPTQLSSPTKSPPPSQSLTPTPLPISPQNNLFSTQTIMVLASVLAVLVVLSVFAFKKGYVTIEVVDEQKEESGQAENQDYNI